jgi:predicted amidophosphoribosyltransferase
MSVAVPAHVEGQTREACPLCQSPLDPEQSWCLRCGAAARTRLAAQPKWKALVVALVVVAVVSLGVLAAALVTLAG